MKNKIVKLSIVLFVVAIGAFNSSYTSKRLVAVHGSTSHRNNKEIEIVNQFVWDQICDKMNLEVKNKPAGNKSDMFSRCPSGYMEHISTQADSICTEKFVDGKIVYYRGCRPTDICYFKVCVAKNFAMVRTKGSQEYLSVAEWIKRKNASVNNRAVVKG